MGLAQGPSAIIHGAENENADDAWDLIIDVVSASGDSGGGMPRSESSEPVSGEGFGVNEGKPATDAHTRSPNLAHKPKKQTRKRPCKGQRERYRMHATRLQEKVAFAPERFDPETIEMPPSIACNAYLRAKMITRLQGFKNSVLTMNTFNEGHKRQQQCEVQQEQQEHQQQTQHQSLHLPSWSYGQQQPHWQIPFSSVAVGMVQC